jgi:acyl CoA:acetate/3-ketoacid CoA transferase beta subunit
VTVGPYRIITDLAVLDVTPVGSSCASAPGVSVEEI